jgi:hypothetical protein
VDDVVTDRTTWSIASGKLLMNFELLLVERGLLVHWSKLIGCDFFAFVVPDYDIFSKCGL